jgi:hypothetical protein
MQCVIGFLKAHTKPTERDLDRLTQVVNMRACRGSSAKKKTGAPEGAPAS